MEPSANHVSPGRFLLGLLLSLAFVFSANAWAAGPGGEGAARTVAGTAVQDAPLIVFNRQITVFRAPMLGVPPALRAQRAKDRVEELLAAGGDIEVAALAIPQGVAIQVNNDLAFVIQKEDVDSLAGQKLDAAVKQAIAALERVASETRESRNIEAMLTAAVKALLTTVAGLVVVLLIRAFWRRVEAWLGGMVGKQAANVRLLGVTIFSPEGALQIVRAVLKGAYWTFVLLLAYIWAGVVLSAFPYTRAWGERLNDFLLALLSTVAGAVVAALPDLVIALLIFFIARFATHLAAGFFERIASGAARVSWVDPDLVAPTRRIAIVVIWLFALAMAYPYLPGAHTEAFKGVSVLIGLMLSLGASSHIGQAVSGLILTYSRYFRRGEYVRIGDHEGTVVDVGVITTRIRTGMGEEIYLPNSLVLSSVTKNYSRAAHGQGFVVDATVTIGYDTPWRQVEAMLVEAARRTEGILELPAPQVFQIALSDFYPEYRLVCQATPDNPHPRAQMMSALHANIQDVFNEYGVQIMSPHYLGDPSAAKVVPPADWFPAPAQPPKGQR